MSAMSAGTPTRTWKRCQPRVDEAHTTGGDRDDLASRSRTHDIREQHLGGTNVRSECDQGGDQSGVVEHAVRGRSEHGRPPMTAKRNGDPRALRQEPVRKTVRRHRLPQHMDYTSGDHAGRGHDDGQVSAVTPMATMTAAKINETSNPSELLRRPAAR